MYPQKHFLSQELSSLVLQSKNIPSDFEDIFSGFKSVTFSFGDFY